MALGLQIEGIGMRRRSCTPGCEGSLDSGAAKTPALEAGLLATLPGDGGLPRCIVGMSAGGDIFLHSL
jgi:hypothetical protein